MIVKDVVDEDFQDYKLPSMFIATSKCDWKCCKELNMDSSLCQNSSVALQNDVEVSADEIFRRYTSNSITKAIIFGGLEPFLQFAEMYEVISAFRKAGCNDDVVIYTGYYPYEIQEFLLQLSYFTNIIVKFGRYMPDDEKSYDPVLGIWLNSKNQYAERIS